jgi:hypothetical protein
VLKTVARRRPVGRSVSNGMSSVAALEMRFLSVDQPADIVLDEPRDQAGAGANLRLG